MGVGLGASAAARPGELGLVSWESLCACDGLWRESRARPGKLVASHACGVGLWQVSSVGMVVGEGV